MDNLDKIIDSALDEDIGSGDLSTNLLISSDKRAKALMRAKSDGIISGLFVAEKVFKKLDNEVDWRPKFKDGDNVRVNDLIVEFEGSYRMILTGERTALNFLQRMSGIATETSKYVEAIKGTKAKILDTRKTVPGLRILDKYAVKMGGGTNHRIGLFDMVMIKDNHIKVAGGILPAVKNVKKRLKNGIQIEVETSNLHEVEEAVEAGADIIMLDNMTTEMMKKSVELINGRAKVEASGNVTLKRVREIAETGVDFISIGALTHSVAAFDIGQYIYE